MSMARRLLAGPYLDLLSMIRALAGRFHHYVLESLSYKPASNGNANAGSLVSMAQPL